MGQHVAILGASDKPERYAHKAFRLLRDHGHVVFPVSPKLRSLEGVDAFASLKDLPGKIDTLTLYVGPETSSRLGPEIVGLRPGRVIFNPGSENLELASRLKGAGIPYLEECTLVLLRTGRF